jgi:MoxR-like ATPase
MTDDASSPSAPRPEPSEDLQRLHARTEAAIAQVRRVVYGQERPVRLMLCCLLSRGHGLLEGVPGTAKTLLARSLSRTVQARFQRIQFTPDLMPSDIVGTHIFDPRTQDFQMREGPVFTDVLLADEINRTPPKTQAALLEVMEERTVTVGGERHAISPIFTVFATQNPLEFEGTYPLPEAQLDRFMMKIEVPYPDEEAERQVLTRYSTGASAHRAADELIEPVLSPSDLDGLLAVVGSVHVEDGVVRYVQRLLAASRQSDALVLGAGTRSGLHLLVAARAWAALSGRDFVTPDDIKELAGPVIAHRLILQADAQVDGLRAEDVLEELLRRVEVPR